MHKNTNTFKETQSKTNTLTESILYGDYRPGSMVNNSSEYKLRDLSSQDPQSNDCISWLTNFYSLALDEKQTNIKSLSEDARAWHLFDIFKPNASAHLTLYTEVVETLDTFERILLGEWEFATEPDIPASVVKELYGCSQPSLAENKELVLAVSSYMQAQYESARLSRSN